MFWGNQDSFTLGSVLWAAGLGVCLNFWPPLLFSFNWKEPDQCPTPGPQRGLKRNDFREHEHKLFLWKKFSFAVWWSILGELWFALFEGFTIILKLIVTRIYPAGFLSPLHFAPYLYLKCFNGFQRISGAKVRFLILKHIVAGFLPVLWGLTTEHY
jgi:hypothetical protein